MTPTANVHSRVGRTSAAPNKKSGTSGTLDGSKIPRDETRSPTVSTRGNSPATLRKTNHHVRSCHTAWATHHHHCTCKTYYIQRFPFNEAPFVALVWHRFFVYVQQVKAEHFPVVGEALIATLSTALGDDFTDEVQQSWIIMYDLMSKIMVRQTSVYRRSFCVSAAKGRCPFQLVGASPIMSEFMVRQYHRRVSARFALFLSMGCGGAPKSNECPP